MIYRRGRQILNSLPNLSGSRTEGFVVAVCALYMAALAIDQEPGYVTGIKEDRTQ